MLAIRHEPDARRFVAELDGRYGLHHLPRASTDSLSTWITPLFPCHFAGPALRHS